MCVQLWGNAQVCRILRRIEHTYEHVALQLDVTSIKDDIEIAMGSRTIARCRFPFAATILSMIAPYSVQWHDSVD